VKPTEHELDWLAFRYVSGEMTADEAETFELRLAEEQSARDAVASAVELSQTIVAAQSLGLPAGIAPASTVRQGWSAHVAWFACGAAACLLIVLAVNFSGTRQGDALVSPGVASRWSERLDLTLDNEDPLAEPVRETDESEETLAASDWMVEAVRSLHADAKDTDDADANEKMES